MRRSPWWSGTRIILSSYRNDEPRSPIMQGAPPAPEWRVPCPARDRPPWNRWSFQHVRELLPTAVIRRGGVATPWERAPVDLEGVAFEGSEGPMTVADRLNGCTDGLLVYLSPERAMVVSKLSSLPDFVSAPHLMDTMRAIDAMAGALGA